MLLIHKAPQILLLTVLLVLVSVVLDVITLQVMVEPEVAVGMGDKALILMDLEMMMAVVEEAQDMFILPLLLPIILKDVY